MASSIPRVGSSSTSTRGRETRAADEGSGDGDAFALPSREVAWVTGLESLETDSGDGDRHGSPSLVGRPAELTRPELDLVVDPLAQQHASRILAHEGEAREPPLDR
jgi:hypothetical protein